MISIDLAAPTIPSSVRAWRMFPGRGYKFVASFLEQQVCFLDLPGLDLPTGRIGALDDLVARISRSDALQDYFTEYGPEFSPNLPLSDFISSRKTQHRTLVKNALVNLFDEAKVGDYITIPSPISYGRIYVGRFGSNRKVSGYYRERYGENIIIARRVHWLGEYAENTISSELSSSLRHEHPFSLLARGLIEEILSLAHGAFVFGERCAATIFNDENDFLDSDAALLGVISRFSSSACKAIDENIEGLASLDILEILLQSPSYEYTCSQISDIHSPGFIRYIGGAATALVISAVVASLIALGENGNKETLKQDIESIQYVNSSTQADPLCTAKVSDASRRILLTLDIDKTWSLCQAAVQAKKRAGLRSSANHSSDEAH